MNSRMSWAGAAIMLFTLGGCASQQGAKKAPSEVPAMAEDPSRGSGVVGEAPQTEEQKTFYALGFSQARQLDVFAMSEEELEYVKAGMTAHSLRKRPAVDLSVYGPKLEGLARARSSAGVAREEVPAKAEDPSRGTSATVGAPQTEEQKTFYALGLAIARPLDFLAMSEEELEFMKAGMTAYRLRQKPAVDLDVYGPRLKDLARARSLAASTQEKEQSRVYLEAAAREPGAQRMESGLIYTSMTEGTGAQPGPTDVVKVHYRGVLRDGKEFDNSYKRNEPAEFPLNGVIWCWREGIQKMKVGGKAKLVCPSGLAYGDRGTNGIPGGSALVFEVELLNVLADPARPEPTPASAPRPPNSKGKQTRK